MKNPNRSEAAKKAWDTRKGRVRSESGHATGAKLPYTYAPPKRWWDYMTREPHGKAGKPLSAAAAGHLWFKVYDDKKRLEILEEWS